MRAPKAELGIISRRVAHSCSNLCDGLSFATLLIARGGSFPRFGGWPAGVRLFETNRFDGTTPTDANRSYAPIAVEQAHKNAVKVIGLG